jgi:CRP-like cAMP-binding protein
MDCGNPLTRLIDRFETISALSREDRILFEEVLCTVRSFGPRDNFIRRGDNPSQCCLLLDGQLIQSRITSLYKRQILSFHVAGDLLGLHTLFLGTAQHNISSIGHSVVCFVASDSIRRLLAKSPNLTRILWRETFVEASIYQEWAVNLGGREAISRVAHLICEMVVRLRGANLVRNLSFDLPWTQHDVGDACGLSNVHVNRVIQTFRSDGVIDWKSKVMKIRRWDELVRIADFNPDYLHIPGEIKHAVGAQGDTDRLRARSGGMPRTDQL